MHGDVKKMTLRPWIFALCAALSTRDAVAQQTAAPPAAIDTYIRRALVDWKVPGIGVAVVRSDSVLFARGYGVRELGKPEMVDEHTVFDAASLTKSFTATLAGMLVDEGRMRWDAPIRTYLPELVFPDPYLTENVTVRDLLAHRVGLQRGDFMWRFTGYDRAEVLRRVRYLRHDLPFRTGLVYSNIGYTIVGEASARRGGAPFETLIRRCILDPLGMRDSYLWSERDGDRLPRANVATSHVVSLDGIQVAVDDRDGPPTADGRNSTAPAGTVQSSVADLATWMRFQLAGGALDGRRLVSELALTELHSPQVIVPTTPAFRRARGLDYFAGYGMGFQVFDYHGHPMLWHSGGGNGQIAYMAILPREQLGVVVLINSWRAPVLHGTIAGRILDHYLGRPASDNTAEALRADSAATAAAATRWQQFLGTRDTSGRKPRRSPASYAGTYEDVLHGAVTIAASHDSLTLELGRPGMGAKADLEPWSGDSLFVRWRNPVYRAANPTLVVFSGASIGGRPDRLMVRLGNDTLQARRLGQVR
jgi:CubicO group peptidase (beta-lactamase class C family)